MFKLNTTPLKAGAQIQKNVLYKINENMILSVQEEHNNNINKEIVNLEYILKDGQYAVFGKEYRAQSVLKDNCKSADVLTCVIDNNNKKIYSLILDIKKDISAFSDDLLKDNALLVAISEVRDFIEQLNHATLHKESFLSYCKYDGYTETAETGIATTNFENKKFSDAADFLERLPKLEKPSNMPPLLWYKFKNSLMPYISEVVRLRNFASQKVSICGTLCHLHVYLLEKVNESEYAVSIKIRLDS